MKIMTSQRLRFTAIEGNGDRLQFTSKGGNEVENAPEWIAKTVMYQATNGAQMTVLESAPRLVKKEKSE